MLELTATDVLLGTTTLLVVWRILFRERGLDHIPTVGYSHPILSWISCIVYLFGARNSLREGYRLFPGGIFKIPTFDGWTVVANGAHHVDDIRKATEEQMSAMESTAAFKYTLGPRILENPFHIEVIRKALTRNIGSRYQDIYDEVVRAYTEAIPQCTDDWVSITAYKLQVDVICRVSSRYFVGQPLCKCFFQLVDCRGLHSYSTGDNPEFRDLCERATAEIFKGRFIRVFPAFLRPFASRLLTDIHNLRAQMADFLQPIIDYRLEQETLHGGEWPDRPNDLITWLIDGARASGEEISAADFSSRLLFTSFGAIHTSSAAFNSALYQLCLNPDDAKELREEVERVTQEEGWTKAALGKMYKMDSYLRESQRMHSIGILSLGRTLFKDFTFSDGTFVPEGSRLAVNLDARHYDENLYSDPEVFNGFRHVRTDGEPQPLVATPTLEYHAFGHGRPACPGRFFAITELKTMLAHLVMNYDVKLEDDVYPSKLMMEANAIPNMSAKVLFRQRQKV
ncbi:hypothetical protein CVT26_005033 [Gymnopilus dilepis]|uniref:Cytochrome P450 n=1 Tax=Gymnopilus dilepis TaxID=231916 RepID=A0A409Y028_9AGAR|nr:hypothetical protein CVT26_005033 [Gymnopilus dilepis]